MATLTVSTNGFGRRTYGSPTPECHTVEDIEHIRYRGGNENGDIAVLTLDPSNALGIAYDLLYQAVDAGLIKGWSVQFPESQQVPSRVLGVDLDG